MNKILLTAFAFLTLALLVITLDVFITRYPFEREAKQEMLIRNYTQCD
jgi:hypothetical protein